MESIIAAHAVDEVIFAYSDVSHELVMPRASRGQVVLAGVDYERILRLAETEADEPVKG